MTNQKIRKQIEKFLSKPDEGFVVRTGEIAGKNATLIFPGKAGVDWNEKNLIFRSLLVDEEFNVISSGFKKFFNFFEKPDIEPWEHTSFMTTEKKDGSLAIISKVGGEVVFRTRGTFSAKTLANGFEVDFFREKYPQVFSHASEERSLLCEWESPRNRIVLDPGDEPKLTLIGAVSHKDLRYVSYNQLRQLSYLTGVPEVSCHHFAGTEDLFRYVEKLEETEGFVLQSPDHQSFRKVKTEWYLKAHKLRTQFNFNVLLGIAERNGWPVDFESMSEVIAKEADFEVAQQSKELIEGYCERMSLFVSEKEKVKRFVDGLPDIPKKELSSEILRRYPSGCWRSGYAFSLVNGNPLKNKVVENFLREKYN